MVNEFRKALRDLVNVHGRDNDLGVPDYILADYMADSLVVLRLALNDLDAHRAGRPRTDPYKGSPNE